jgi:hypothetical protein
VRSHFHFVPADFSPRTTRLAVCAVALAGMILACPAKPAAAQAAPEIVAHIQGNDLSINGQPLVPVSTLVSVANGNEVTVHSGQASMRLVDGGEISVCGPAKFTVLANSDGVITLALDFGRMHVELPASASLRVLTPSIVATPIDINGGKRDVTVGLDQNDSLCVVAAIGAVQLEQQFSGQRLIIPESGDFSLQNGQLVPVIGTAQNCTCAALPQIGPAENSKAPETASEPLPPSVAPAAVANSASQPANEEAPFAVGVLAHTNESHPVTSPKDVASQPAPEPAPDYKIVLPPLVFSSASPVPPDVPTEETAMLVREIHDDPDWEFTGHVEAPSFAGAMSKALGESGDASQSQNSPPPAGSTEKKSSGFWSSLKRLFIG